MNSQQETFSDKDLIRQAARGDKDAFGILYERYLDDIYRYVYYRVMNVEESEDLTEAVFLRAWESLHKTKGRKIKNFRAWLYRITHNLTIDYLRKKRPVSIDMQTSERLTSQLAPGAEKIAEARFGLDELNAAIHTLDELQQQVVTLRFLNELSHAETAAILNLSEGNVRVIQYRALKALRKQLSEDQNNG